MTLRIAISLLSVTGLLSADTLTLKNGSTINGHFVGGDDRSVRFASGSQVNTYDVIDIESLRFTQPSTRSTMTQPPPPPPPSAESSSSSSSSSSYGPPANSNEPYRPAPRENPGNLANMEIPAGTQVVVRLIDAVDSKMDHLGQTYRASVEQPVVINGQTLIPRGSDAVAVLSDDQRSGRIQGKTVLTIALRSVSVNGQTYDLATSNVSKSSGSRTTRSGEVIGGTAALGAIIGALAGGGRGAAIGAVSGGAVGTAAQVATSGERVKIPSETSLTFALQNPLYVSSN